jgi:hypothetical protein
LKYECKIKNNRNRLFDGVTPFVIRIYRIQRVSQTQQYSVMKQYYIMLAGLHISTLPESSLGPQGTDPYSE